MAGRESPGVRPGRSAPTLWEPWTDPSGTPGCAPTSARSGRIRRSGRLRTAARARRRDVCGGGPAGMGGDPLATAAPRCRRTSDEGATSTAVRRRWEMRIVPDDRFDSVGVVGRDDRTHILADVNDQPHRLARTLRIETDPVPGVRCTPDAQLTGECPQTDTSQAADGRVRNPLRSPREVVAADAEIGRRACDPAVSVQTTLTTSAIVGHHTIVHPELRVRRGPAQRPARRGALGCGRGVEQSRFSPRRHCRCSSARTPPATLRGTPPPGVTTGSRRGSPSTS